MTEKKPAKKRSNKRNWFSKKHNDYSYRSRKNNLGYDLTAQEARLMMSLPCFYCASSESRGLDRKDSSKGYERANLLPCCKVCNFILSDMPFLAKVELREGLRSMNEKKLLGDWSPAGLKTGFKRAPAEETEENELPFLRLTARAPTPEEIEQLRANAKKRDEESIYQTKKPGLISDDFVALKKAADEKGKQIFHSGFNIDDFLVKGTVEQEKLLGSIDPSLNDDLKAIATEISCNESSVEDELKNVEAKIAMLEKQGVSREKSIPFFKKVFLDEWKVSKDGKLDGNIWTGNNPALELGMTRDGSWFDIKDEIFIETGISPQEVSRALEQLSPPERDNLLIDVGVLDHRFKPTKRFTEALAEAAGAAKNIDEFETERLIQCWVLRSGAVKRNAEGVVVAKYPFVWTNDALYRDDARKGTPEHHDVASAINEVGMKDTYKAIDDELEERMSKL